MVTSPSEQIMRVQMTEKVMWTESAKASEIK